MVCLYPIHLKTGVCVPCGKCASCLQKKVKDTQFRLHAEVKDEKNLFSGFLTLTYSPENLPKDGVCKRDVQLFFKRLRKAGWKFKYIVVSEYGPETFRPHYHALVFFQKVGKTYIHVRDLFDIEKSICRFWQLGNIELNEILEERITYIANYHVTRGFSPQGKNINFRQSSKGLGINFIESEKKVDWIRHNQCSNELGFQSAVPRYYRDKVIITEEEKEEIKSKQDPDYFHLINERVVNQWKSLMYWQDKVKRKIIYKKNKI